MFVFAKSHPLPFLGGVTAIKVDLGFFGNNFVLVFLGYSKFGLEGGMIKLHK
jgi:hypothetical protein